MEPNNPPPINVDFFEDLTGAIAPTAETDIDEIGRRIQRIRNDKGLSLKELSNLTGFPAQVIEGIESGTVHPQLGTVIKLSKALDSAFGRLVSGRGDKLYSITRREEQKIIHRSTSHTGKQKLYTYKSLAPEVKGRHMESLIVTLEENREPEMAIHDGEEFIYVLEGEVILVIDQDKFELRQGDSVYYLSTTAHMIAAKSGQAKILAVIYGQ